MAGNYKLDYTGDQTNEAIGIALNCQKLGFYKEDPDNAQQYEDRARECLRSWLVQDYASTAITSTGQEHWGTDEDEDTHNTIKTVFRYGFQGYIKAPIGYFYYRIGTNPIEQDLEAYKASIQPQITAAEQRVADAQTALDNAQTEQEREEAQAELDAATVALNELRATTLLENYQGTNENVHVAVGYNSTTGTYTYDARAMEMDCCVFASLITKCYTYEDSIYKNVMQGNFDLQKALHDATYAYRSDRRTYIGQDGNNNVTTDEWAEGLYYSGTRFNLFAHTGANEGDTTIYPNAVSNLRTGDLVFFGIGNEKRKDQFLGIHHVGVYVKTLSELNFGEYTFDVSDVPNGSRTPGYDDGQYGYIVHVEGRGRADVPANTSPNYINVLRIDTMEWAAKYYNVNVDSDLVNDPPMWHNIYTCHVLPNTLNVSGGMEASTSWRNAWGKAFFTNWHDTKHFFSIKSKNGGVHTTSVGESGYYLENGVDFNSMLENGMYRFSSNPANNRLTNNQNMPIYSMGYLRVENNPVVDRYKEHGAEQSNIFMTVQTYVAFPYSDQTPNDNQMVIYKSWIGHTGTTATQWSPWYKVFDSADIAGSSHSARSKPAIVQRETTVRPMVKKYF